VFNIREFLQLKVLYAVLKVFRIVMPCCSVVATCYVYVSPVCGLQNHLTNFYEISYEMPLQEASLAIYFLIHTVGSNSRRVAQTGEVAVPCNLNVEMVWSWGNRSLNN
jgi:hypothetical protein